MNSKKVIIHNEEYELISDYKDIEQYRQSLNYLTQKTFGFSFEPWYSQGYWGDKYRPYSLAYKGEVVANVSVNPIDFLIDGCLHPIIQIGTVMTAEEFRHKGLSKILMEEILNNYSDSCEMIYLYGNDTVLDFYPRFGFVKAVEYIQSKTFYKQDDNSLKLDSPAELNLSFRKLNLQVEKDKAILTRLVTDTVPVSRVSMIGNPGLKMFYLAFMMSENIYYDEEADLAAVAEYEEDKMTLIDLYCSRQFDLDEVILSLVNKPSMKVQLGFTPIDSTAFITGPLKVEDQTFFVRGRNLIGEGRFPVLSHA